MEIFLIIFSLVKKIIIVNLNVIIEKGMVRFNCYLLVFIYILYILY